MQCATMAPSAHAASGISPVTTCDAAGIGKAHLVSDLPTAREQAMQAVHTLAAQVTGDAGLIIGSLWEEDGRVYNAGLLLAEWPIQFFASIRVPTDIPISIRARMDGRVLGYTTLAMTASVILCGLWPALKGTRTDLVSPVKGSAKNPAGH